MSAFCVSLAAAHKHPSWADFGPVEWVAIVVVGIMGAWTIWKAAIYTLRPGEEEPEHIKRSILNDEFLQATTAQSDSKGPDPVDPKRPKSDREVPVR